MTYQQTLQYLYASQPAFHLVGSKAYKPGLDNTHALMEHLGHPYRHWPAIHVAGTNGKGSTSHLIAASLQSAGLKVGLYTSPHLVDFRERIRINGQMIPEGQVVRFVTENKDYLDTVHPSFFESTMAMAFWYFAEQHIDIAVVEVGLGGRLDSTNILPPYDGKGGVLLSVITNIGLDHTEFLGNTLAQIATEKAGIIKPAVPCIIGESDPETQPVFMQAATKADSPIWFADECAYLRRQRKRFITECELHGIYQDKNMQTAYVALRALTLCQWSHGLIHRSAIADGFAHVCTLTGLRGRWETLATHPLTICDTGHNSHGIKYVVEQLNALTACNAKDECHRRLHVVFGMVSDKDVEIVMGLLHRLPSDTSFYFTQAHTSRAIEADTLCELYGQGNKQAYSTVQDAIESAQKAAAKQDIIFIGGSNYVVGEALSLPKFGK